MNGGFIILLVLSGWAPLSLMVAATIGSAARRRDADTPSRPADPRRRRIAS